MIHGIERQAFYDNVNLITIFIYVIFVLFHFQKEKQVAGYVPKFIQYKISNSNRLKNIKFLSGISIWAFLQTLIIGASYFAPSMFVNDLFSKIFDTGMNYFGLLICGPVFFIAASLLMGSNPLDHINIFTPGLPLAHIFTRIACFGFGCCSGINCSFGIYNEYKSATQFPLQLVDSAFALIFFIILMSTRRRMKAGQAYPIYVIMYSSARFCYEFFRNNDPVLGPLQTYHLLCIAGVVIGVVELLIVNKFGDSINDFFERNSFENKLKNKDRKGRVKK